MSSEKKRIKCVCGHQWSSSAKGLTSRGVYCRSCGNKDVTKLQWVSEYTDTTLKYTQAEKDQTDFLQQEVSAKQSKKSVKIPKDTTSTKEPTAKDFTAEDKGTFFVDKAEQVVTKAGKGKYNLRSLPEMENSVLRFLESLANRRFESSGYGFRYDKSTENIREEIVELFNEIYGFEGAIDPKLALLLLTVAYTSPAMYHEFRYKSLGVKIKTFYSRFRAKLKEKQLRKQEAKENKESKKMTVEKIEEEIEGLTNGSDTQA